MLKFSLKNHVQLIIPFCILIFRSAAQSLLLLPHKSHTHAMDILQFLSGYGFWILLAVALIVVVVYKKMRK